MAAPPVTHGRLFDTQPDLRLACAALPAAAELVVVEDSAKDARIGNGLPAEARFFALARIETVEGHPLGALCVLDETPRELTILQTEYLIEFAALASEVIDEEGPNSRWSKDSIEDDMLLSSVGAAVFCPLLISKDGVIISANNHAASLIGIDNADPLIGKHVSDLVPEEHVDKVKAQLSVSGQYEVDIVHAQGHTLRVEVQAISTSKDGHTLRIAAFRLAANGA